MDERLLVRERLDVPRLHLRWRRRLRLWGGVGHVVTVTLWGSRVAVWVTVRSWLLMGGDNFAF